MKGFIQIDRDDFENELWNEKRQYSRFEAWLDLRQLARITDDQRSMKIKGREVSCGKNQIIATFRFLSKRWQWSIHKVQLFLSYLKSKEKIDCNADSGINVISLKKCGTNGGMISDTNEGTYPNTHNTTEIQEVTASNDTSDDTYRDTNEGTNKDTKQKNVYTEDCNIQKNKERIISKDIIPKKAELSLTDRKSQDESIDFDKLMQIFNTMFRGRLPAIIKMTDKRKAMVRARVKEYGKEKVMEAFQKAYDSDFCNGVNKNGWKATFDFIFTKSKFQNLIEGNYDNRERISEHASVLRDIAKDVFGDYRTDSPEIMEREREIQELRKRIWGAKPKELEETTVRPEQERLP